MTIAGYPLHEPLIIGHIRNSNHFKATTQQTSKGFLELVSNWEPLFTSKISLLVNGKTDIHLPMFLKKEKVQSFCFLPIGSPRSKLGTLFINYLRLIEFDDNVRYTLQTFKLYLSQVVSRIKYREIMFNSYGRPKLNLHTLIARHGLKIQHSESFSDTINKTWRGCCSDKQLCATIDSCVLCPILQSTSGLLDEIRLEKPTVPPNFWQDTLKEHIDRHISILPEIINDKNLKIPLDIEASIELENGWIKLALFRVIVECINNAIIHGHATRIHICARRSDKFISLIIINNGDPLPKNQTESAHGIFALLGTIKNKLGAETKIYNNLETKKVTISVIIPTIPYTITHVQKIVNR